MFPTDTIAGVPVQSIILISITPVVALVAVYVLHSPSVVLVVVVVGTQGIISIIIPDTT